MLGINECDLYGRRPESWGDAVLMSFTPLFVLTTITVIVLAWLVWQVIRGGD